MPHLEEITYDIGRAALADQESLVSGIRSRTGTLVAAQALVASFLGGAVADRGSFGVFGWAAMTMLVLGLVLAVVLLWPWPLRFSLEAAELYNDLRAQADEGTLRWLLLAALAHKDIQRRNLGVVRRLVRFSAALSVVTVVQIVLWIAAVAVR